MPRVGANPNAQKTLWEPPRKEAPPGPAPERDDEKTLLEASRRMSAPARLEPTLKEELDPWYAQWSAFRPRVEEKSERGRDLPVPLPWLAAGLAVLLLLIGFVVYKTFFAHDIDRASMPATVPAPMPPIKPEPMPTPAPELLRKAETPPADARPDHQAKPAQGPKTPSRTSKSANPAAGNAHTGRKAAPAKPADNCKNPDVNERSVECVFR